MVDSTMRRYMGKVSTGSRFQLSVENFMFFSCFPVYTSAFKKTVFRLSVSQKYNFLCWFSADFYPIPSFAPVDWCFSDFSKVVEDTTMILFKIIVDSGGSGRPPQRNPPLFLWKKIKTLHQL